MGFLNFLKKKEAVPSNVPRPPTAPGGAMVSKFDDRLQPMPAIAPPPPPGSMPITPLPSMRSDAPKPSLPPMPTMAVPPKAPVVPSMPKVAPVAPSVPKLEPAKPVVPVMAPPSLPPLSAAPIKTVAPEPQHDVLPKPLPPPSLDSVKRANSNVMQAESKVSMPQLTPPISGKTLPPSRPKTVEMAPAKPKSAAPADDELRRILSELEQIPISFDKQMPAQMPENMSATPALGRFVPLARFDDMVVTIRAVATAVTHVRGLNEKLGHVETSTKTTIDDIGKAFEGLHTKLLALDEKLFQAK